MSKFILIKCLLVLIVLIAVSACAPQVQALPKILIEFEGAPLVTRLDLERSQSQSNTLSELNNESAPHIEEVFSQLAARRIKSALAVEYGVGVSLDFEQEYKLFLEQNISQIKLLQKALDMHDTEIKEYIIAEWRDTANAGSLETLVASNYSMISDPIELQERISEDITELAELSGMKNFYKDITL